MALNKQISQFRIVANSTNHDMAVQNMNLEWVPEDYTDVVTAVGGKKYKNMAGLRARVELTYDKSIDPDDWRSLINDIITDFVTNEVESIEFYPDNSNTTSSDKIEVIPDEASYRTMYSGQIGRFVPSLTLVGLERATSISTNFEAP